MILGEVFERFATDSPLTVMARAVMENALNPAIVDQLFEDVADAQYTRKLLFSSVVDLMSVVVCRIKPAIHAAYKARAATIGVSVKAVYDKLDRVEPAISAALVGTTARRLEPVIDAMDGACSPLLPGYRVKILDGNHLASTEHRIQELRTLRAGALPGQALVVLDPRLMLVTDVVLCEDGHAQERSLLESVLPLVDAKDVWIDDRNFCTTSFLFGIAARQAFFVTRQHASTLRWEFVGKRRHRGRTETGEVYEQTIRASGDAGEILVLRRITVVLDEPTRDGDREIHLLTNLPRRDAPARVIAELYRKRWTIETAFAGLAETLDGEVNTLGYPKAALFAFCVALVAYNVHSVLKAALRLGPRRAAGGRGGVGVLRGRGGADDPSGDDDRDPRGRVGGVPRHDAGGVGRGPGGVGGGGADGGVSQAAPRAEEADAEEAERSQDQACRHRQGILAAPQEVYNLISRRGWFHPPYENTDGVAMPDAFRVEELDGGIALVTFDLPDKKVNTLGQAVLRELAGLVAKLAQRTDLRACCSGAASRGSSSPGPTSTTWRCWPTSRPSRRPGRSAPAIRSTTSSASCRSRRSP